MQSTNLCISSSMTGSGKTIFTSALIKSLMNRGHIVSSGKIGPDYIDPTFTRHITNRSVFNYDTWAMTDDKIKYLMNKSSESADIHIIEGVMGLFDGTKNQSSSTAEFVKKFNIPVLLILDASGQSQTLAAICRGIIDYDNGISFIGVILNKISSERHFDLINEELKKSKINVLGYIPKSDDFVFPRRHLGLFLAEHIEDYQYLINNTANILEKYIDIDEIIKLSKIQNDVKGGITKDSSKASVCLGQRISIAKDQAFSFIYDCTLHRWKEEGREIYFFSPLDDQVPPADCTGIFLPGGYPELYCEKLANCSKFISSMRLAADQKKFIYGECGGYMVLGESIIDKDNKEYAMLGLLNLVTSFNKRKLNLGYRKVISKEPNCFNGEDAYMCHEYHYSSIVKERGKYLFESMDDDGLQMKYGLINNNVFGSFLHVIDNRSTLTGDENDL